MKGKERQHVHSEGFGDVLEPPDLTEVADRVLARKGFYFQQRRGKVDLRAINRVDLERIVNEVDIDALQMHLENLTFASLCEDDLRLHSDSTLVKLFRLAQLTIEYLLNVQDTLARQLDKLAFRYGESTTKLDRLRSKLSARDADIVRLKRELKHRRKTLETYERMLAQASLEPVPVAAAPPPPAEVPPRDRDASKEQHIRVFVVMPDGSCVVSAGGRSLTVGDLKARILPDVQASLEATGVSLDEPLSVENIRLSFQGVRLQDDKTLAECDVPNDASLFCIVKDKPKVKDSGGGTAGATENAGRRLEAVMEVKTREMVEVVKEEALRSRQQEERFIHDQERAVSSLEGRLAEFERQVLQMLEVQRNEALKEIETEVQAHAGKLQEHMHRMAPVSFADRMEDDRGDDAVVASNEELRAKLAELPGKMGELKAELRAREAEKTALAAELETMRRAMRDQEKDSELEMLRVQHAALQQQMAASSFQLSGSVGWTAVWSLLIQDDTQTGAARRVDVPVASENTVWDLRHAVAGALGEEDPTRIVMSVPSAGATPSRTFVASTPLEAIRSEYEQGLLQVILKPSSSGPQPPSRPMTSLSQRLQVMPDSLSVEERVRMLMSRVDERIMRRTQESLLDDVDMDKVRELQESISSQLDQLEVTAAPDITHGDLRARMSDLQLRRDSLPSGVKALLDKIGAATETSVQSSLSSPELAAEIVDEVARVPSRRARKPVLELSSSPGVPECSGFVEGATDQTIEGDGRTTEDKPARHDTRKSHYRTSSKANPRSPDAEHDQPKGSPHGGVQGEEKGETKGSEPDSGAAKEADTFARPSVDIGTEAHDGGPAEHARRPSLPVKPPRLPSPIVASAPKEEPSTLPLDQHPEQAATPADSPQDQQGDVKASTPPPAVTPDGAINAPSTPLTVTSELEPLDMDKLPFSALGLDTADAGPYTETLGSALGPSTPTSVDDEHWPPRAAHTHYEALSPDVDHSVESFAASPDSLTRRGIAAHTTLGATTDSGASGLLGLTMSSAGDALEYSADMSVASMMSDSDAASPVRPVRRGGGGGGGGGGDGLSGARASEAKGFDMEDDDGVRGADGATTRRGSTLRRVVDDHDDEDQVFALEALATGGGGGRGGLPMEDDSAVSPVRVRQSLRSDEKLGPESPDAKHGPVEDPIEEIVEGK